MDRAKPWATGNRIFLLRVDNTVLLAALLTIMAASELAIRTAVQGCHVYKES